MTDLTRADQLGVRRTRVAELLDNNSSTLPSSTTSAASGGAAAPRPVNQVTLH